MQNPNNNSFFERVYEVVRLVPYGRVTSYGAIARYLGTAGSARMVGWAMNNSPAPALPEPCLPAGRGERSGDELPIPAHRVVNRNGMLTGKRHFGGSDVMKQLLESEGIEIIDDQVQNFEELLWDPMKELR